MKKIILLLVLFGMHSLYAQDSFIIKNVRLFDGEKVIENTSVLIENGKISKIAPVIKENHNSIDGAGKTLIPALTNAHVHAWSPSSLQEAAKAGVINVLDMHGVEQYQGMLKVFKDSTNYANFFVAGAAATMPEGHGTQFGFPTPTLTKPEEAKQFISDRVVAKVDYIKIILEPWKKTLSHETVKALIDEAHKQNMVAVVHISKVDDAYKVLNNNANGLVHLWWDKLLPEDQLQKLSKEKNFFVIPTLLTSIKATVAIKQANPNATFLSEEQMKSEIKRLYDAGIPILAGTDPPNAQINYGTDLYKELILLSESGIPTIDVLKGATSIPIKRFKLGKKGMIKKGYVADLILLDGNPLKEINDISKINTVWKAGKKVNLK